MLHTTTIPLETVASSGTRETLYLDPAVQEPWFVDVTFSSGLRKRYPATSLFSALIELRRELEQQGKLLLCAGSRPDVIVSGMSISMGGGRVAYRVRIGENAAMSDRIDIFSPATLEEVSSISEQRRFRDEWLSAPRLRSVE